MVVCVIVPAMVVCVFVQALVVCAILKREYIDLWMTHFILLAL